MGNIHKFEFIFLSFFFKLKSMNKIKISKNVFIDFLKAISKCC